MRERTNYLEYLAYVTTKKDRVICGGGLMLYAQTPEEASELSLDIAKAIRCDVVQLKCGDYLLVSVPK